MTSNIKNNWHKSSWRSHPIKQQPKYEDLTKLAKTEKSLSSYPALIYFDEAIKLKKHLANVSNGEAFLLQAGDCAESFAEFNEKNLKLYFQIILQMTAALMYGLNKPIVKVGRIAGQFAKPRSSDFEEINGKKIPSYRGDMVNSIAENMNERVPNPENLLKAYQQSGTTLNFIRALASGGFASLDNIYSWLNDFSNVAKNNTKITDIIAEIAKSSSFFKACGYDLSAHKDYNSAEFFTSHEALLLNYEECLTRFNPIDERYYACSAHMLWIGERTRNLDEAHIEFFRGIANPIASKVGPTMQKDELLKLIDTLNPQNEPGRLTLISRMGADNINNKLPQLVEATKAEGLNVIWSCDPMHGNTETSSNDFKTRKFDNIFSEVNSFFDIHKSLNSYAGGIHLEMTGQNVTECLGGTEEITESCLAKNYNTHCDPRLNGHQSLELAFLIARKLQNNN